jgi:hypothetical protein
MVKREVSLSGIPISQKLAGKEDLPSQLKSEIIMDKTPTKRTLENFLGTLLAMLIESVRC